MPQSIKHEVIAKDPCMTKSNSTWWQRRTSLEKCLFIFVVIGYLLFIALVAATILLVLNYQGKINLPFFEYFKASYENNWKQEFNLGTMGHGKKICLSEGCVKAASALLSNMDPTVDPCDNFYDFACGGWAKKNVIPDDRSQYGIFTQVAEQLDVALKAILEQPVGKYDSVTTIKAKDVYKACLNDTLVDSFGSAPLQTFLEEIGSWPVISRSWDASKFRWIDTVANLRLYGENYIIEMNVWANAKNASQNIIQLDQPDLGLPSRDYFLSSTDEKYVEAYYQFMKGVSKVLGGNGSETDLKDIVDFETLLANISSPASDRRNMERMYNKMTIAELKKFVPEVDWMSYIQKVLPKELNVTEQEEVVVMEVDYFKQLGKIISQTQPRVLANYLIWRIISRFAWHLDHRFREVKQEFYNILYGTSGQGPRWPICIAFTNNNLGMAVGSLYVREYFKDGSKETALEMIQDLRTAFSEILEELDWMDDTTRRRAKEKAEAIAEKIGYPEFILNATELDNFYKGLTVTPDRHFLNVLQLEKYSTQFFLSQLRKPYDKTRWSSQPALVNAWYSPDNNDITFPAGILQPPFFSHDQPKSLNYGAIGIVIGHEITHGFDDEGHQRDKDGNLRQWWPDDIIKAFQNKAHCLVSQYGNYTVSEVNMSLDGTLTLGENLADNGGLKQAFQAYRAWVKRHGEEPPLPALMNYTHNQLFFINYASLWCESYRSDSYVNQLLTGHHSPGKYRVIGALSNSPEFSEAFHCPKGSAMNSENKCRVW